MSRELDRRGLLALAATAAITGLAACSDNSSSGTSASGNGSSAPAKAASEHQIALAKPAQAALVAAADADLTLGAALFEKATVVVVAATAAQVPDAAKVAQGLGVPLLVADPSASTSASASASTTASATGSQSGTGATASGQVSPTAKASDAPPTSTLAAELDRLGARTVVAFPEKQNIPGGREVIAGTSGGSLPEIDGFTPAAPRQGSGTLLAAPGTAISPAVAANAAAAGYASVQLTHADPRGDDAALKALRATPDAPVVGLGSALGKPDRFAQRVRTATSAKELPGGGLLPFPKRHMIALYGHPTTPSLGMLGEQNPKAAVARAQKLVDQYRALLPDATIVPAFEIIATIASANAEPDKSYSRRSPIAELMPLVETAEANDVYCMIDLQPGRNDFLSQAKEYEELLKRPWMGLALDPEWRLRPNEKHLVNIGHVDIAEVNEVGRWLDQLITENNLPPKVLTLHQFQLQMIRGREKLDTSLDNIQWLVHVDGSGGQGAKQGTWNAMKKGLPKGVWLGWKNFEDEDFPMLTVPQTVAQVKPFPQFVSYQ